MPAVHLSCCSFTDKSTCLFNLRSYFVRNTAFSDQCIDLPAAEVVMDCCLQKSEKYLPPKILVSYSIQEAGKGCEIRATV